MAAEDGRKGPDLSDLVRGEPYRFDFFQAVRVLEAAARLRADSDPRHPAAAVGRDHAPHREHVRFRAAPSLSFPAAPLAQVRGSTGAGPAEAVVTFLGLFGPHGVLPPHYTALLLRRLRDKDFALRDFLDLFNHRAVSLFYRAWEKYRLPIAFERAARDGVTDPATQVVYCFAGFGTDGLRGRQAVPDGAFLYYAGHFAHFPRSAVALEALLADYFGLPVEVEQAAGQWLTLADADRSRLPDDEFPDGMNAALGLTALAGERVWDVQSKFRIAVGPLTYAEFRRFMPDGDGLRQLGALTRTYVGPELDFEVVPLLKPTDAPPLVLAGDGPDGPQLGWNTWVHDGDYDAVLSDASFFVEPAPAGV
jgi:type VI secretion system protein ImpH